jgi:hypothetical protein
MIWMMIHERKKNLSVLELTVIQNVITYSLTTAAKLQPWKIDIHAPYDSLLV